MTDAAVLRGMADSTLLVARAGSTERRRCATRPAPGTAARPVRGALLNDLDTARAGFGYYGMEEKRQNGRRNGKDH